MNHFKKIFKHAALTLLFIGGIYSCSKNADSECLLDIPDELILGKWELVEIHSYYLSYYIHSSVHEQPHQPNGYFEFRQEGIVLWFDYAKKEYSQEGIYWITRDIGVNCYYNHSHLHVNLDIHFLAQEDWNLPFYNNNKVCLQYYYSKDRIGVVYVLGYGLPNINNKTFIFNRIKK